MQGKLIPEVHTLRGLAIAAIVFLHAFDVGPGVTFAVKETLFHDTTIVFALISGILFSRVYARVPAGEYYRKRLEALAAPYLIFTTLFTAISLTAEHRLAVSFDLAQIGLNLTTGRAQFTYWYMIVALALVALAPPLFRATQLWPRALLVLALTIPLFVSRQGIEVSGSTFTYFASAFVLGLCCERYYAAICEWLKQNRLLLWAGALLPTLLLIGSFWFERPLTIGFVDARESLFWIQKLSVFGLVLTALRGAKPGPAQQLLSVLARYAFTIYFLHVAFEKGAHLVLDHYGPTAWFAADTIAFCAGLLGPLAFGVLAQSFMSFVRRIAGASPVALSPNLR